MLLLIDCVNIYFSQSIIFVNIFYIISLNFFDFLKWKSVGLPTLLMSALTLKVSLHTYNFLLQFYCKSNYSNIIAKIIANKPWLQCRLIKLCRN